MSIPQTDLVETIQQLKIGLASTGFGGFKLDGYGAGT
jgi:hypothetical protein